MTSNVETCSFIRSDPPLEIEGFGFINFSGLTTRMVDEGTWRYFPTIEERKVQGLRIELHQRTDGTGEARLVKGPYLSPKHLLVIRVRRFTPLQLRPAAAQLRQAYFEKGW